LVGEESEGFGMKRLQLLVRSILLRRTKNQKIAGSKTPLVVMPTKYGNRSFSPPLLNLTNVFFRLVYLHQAKLSEEEQTLYDKLLSLSRKALKKHLNWKENSKKKDWDRKVTYENKF
jgi:hypothetical protein